MRLAPELKLIEEEIETLSYLKKNRIVGKAIPDLIERIEYKFYEANSEVISYNKDYDYLFILLDGTLTFSVDLDNPLYRDGHIQEITKDIGQCKN